MTPAAETAAELRDAWLHEASRKDGNGRTGTVVAKTLRRCAKDLADLETEAADDV